MLRRRRSSHRKSLAPRVRLELDSSADSKSADPAPRRARVAGSPTDPFAGSAKRSGSLAAASSDREHDALERAERGALEVRAALGVDQPPTIGPEFLGKLMRQPRLADARVAQQQDRLPACARVFSSARQQGPLRCAIDEPRDAARPPHPPARQIARAYDPVDRQGLVEAAQRLAAQKFKADMSVGELLTGFRHVDLVRLGRRLQPRGQMLGGTADLVDLGELAGDHVGDDMPGVETDPDLKAGIAEADDAPDQLDRRMAGQGRMVVVRDRGAEHRGKRRRPTPC